MGTAVALSLSRKAKIILVVDDDSRIRRTVCDELISSGLCPVEAANGAEALTAAAKLKPHLIILDVAMPIMNGLEAAPRLRRLLPATPIILYALYGSNVNKKLLSAFGITEIVSKEEPLQNLILAAQSLVS